MILMKSMLESLYFSRAPHPWHSLRGWGARPLPSRHPTRQWPARRSGRHVLQSHLGSSTVFFHGGIWYDMICHDMISWHDMIWYDMIWSSGTGYDKLTSMLTIVYGYRKLHTLHPDQLGHLGEKIWLNERWPKSNVKGNGSKLEIHGSWQKC